MYQMEWKGSPHFTPNVRKDPHSLAQRPLIVLHTMAGPWQEPSLIFTILLPLSAVIMVLAAKAKFISMSGKRMLLGQTAES